MIISMYENESKKWVSFAFVPPYERLKEGLPKYWLGGVLGEGKTHEESVISLMHELSRPRGRTNKRADGIIDRSIFYGDYKPPKIIVRDITPRTIKIEV